MILETTWPAGPHRRFAADAFAANLGQPIRVVDTTGPNPVTRQGTLLSADVAPDGREVILRVDVDLPIDIPLRLFDAEQP